MLYKIIIKEVLPIRMSGHFEPLTVSSSHQHTVLTGDIVDQAALFGIISKIRDLHLTLISINPI